MSETKRPTRPLLSPSLGALVALAVGLGGVLPGAAAQESPAAVVSASPVRDLDPVDPGVVELGLEGIDAQAEDELERISATQPTQVTDVDPETSPALTTDDALGVLSDSSTPAVLTERLDADPFSVMGVTWDLSPDLDGVVVQYRVFQGGGWTPWAWVAASEEYLEVGGSAPTRGATDAIFVPDSTGVQVLLSSTQGTAAGVKIVLIDPGTGPDGQGASKSSGDPTDMSTSDPDMSPDAPAPTSTPDPDVAPTTAPVQPVEPVEPDYGPLEPETTPAPAPTNEEPAPELSPSPAPLPEDLQPEGQDPAGEPTPVPSSSAQSATGTVSTVSTLSSGTSIAPAQLRTASTTARPRIVTRAEWGASQPVCVADLASSTVAAAVHHTASTNAYTAAQVPGLLRGFAEYHTRPEAQGGRGWCDIGYNFLVDKFGTIYEGRASSTDAPVVGVHTGGFNSRTVGIAAIGNYQDAAPSAALVEAISQVIAWKFAQHRILANASVTLVSGGGASKYPAGTAVAFNTIYGHRDAQFTACPGQYLYAALGAIRNRVASLSNAAVFESPVGAWDSVTGDSGSVRVRGWARDPGVAGAQVQVQVLLDGSLVTTLTASQYRADVGAHGFDSTVASSSGPHIVCLRYLNVGAGNDVHMGCRSVVVAARAPVGVIDQVSSTPSTIRVRGWARDPDSSSPISVHVYIDGVAVRSVRADVPRPDVDRSSPEAGPAHGFDATLAATPGRHVVCVYGINVGPGANAHVGCADVVVENKAPIGHLDQVKAAGPDSLTVRGWALDPDTTDPIAVHAYVDGVLVQGAAANGPRSDIGRIFGLGEAHGFSLTLAAAPGVHTVCVYGIDSAKGRNPQLGCASVTVVNKTPIGVLDTATGGAGEVRVRGWALDPDTTAPIMVHVYVDGRAVRAARAESSRPDVGRAFGLGDAHGVDVSVPVTEGQHTVCLYAINATPGLNPRVGCVETTARSATS